MINGNTALMGNLKNISKRYTRGSRSFEVFKDYSLTVKKQELLVLSGRSGSGKSTLLALLGGYLKPDEGEVFFEEENLLSKGDEELSRLHGEHIGYLPQSNVMVSEFTILENVMLKSLILGTSNTKDKALSLLKLFGIEALADRFPHELSGGELRRVSLARLFLSDPDFYLIDEPSGGLDKEATKIVMDYLKARVRSGKTVVVATHDDIVKEYADRVLEIGEAMKEYSIRKATAKDLDEITELEAICFPAAEAATKESFKSRLEKYPDYFFLLFISGKLVSMVNGLVTDFPDLRDEMYEDASMHDPKGDWQMIFGVDTHPDHQRRGYAEAALKAFIDNARSENRKGVVLTCKDKLLHYYEKFGFVSEGISASTHGDVTWYQMRLKF